MTRFELETRIAAPVPLVFGLSRDVDAHTASMARSGERLGPRGRRGLDLVRRACVAAFGWGDCLT
ncbi:hypothetical protein ACH5AU_01680 [Streptomyces albidoflavus]